MADNHVKVNRGLSFTPRASAPSNPVNGDMYYDLVLSKFRKYENGVWSDLSGPSASSQFNIVVGSSTDVTSGDAQYSSIITALASSVTGDRILILPSYVGTENISITKQLSIAGLGRASVISGTVTFTSAADYSRLTNIKVTDNITLNAGADGVICDDLWLASGKTFLVDSTVTGEYLMAIQES